MADADGTLTFEKFWRWVLEHPNCILRASAYDATLFDGPDFHWELYDEEDGRAVVQLLKGKTMVGEILIDRQELLHVSASPDVDEGHKGCWLFELVGGTRAEHFPVAHFLVSHGMEQVAGHQALKH